MGEGITATHAARWTGNRRCGRAAWLALLLALLLAPLLPGSTARAQDSTAILGRRPQLAVARVRVDGVPAESPLDRHQQRRLRLCYEHALHRNAHVAGTVRLNWVVGTDGTVTESTGRADASSGLTVVAACMARVVQWRRFASRARPVRAEVRLDLSTSAVPDPG